MHIDMNIQVVEELVRISTALETMVQLMREERAAYPVPATPSTATPGATVYVAAGTGDTVRDLIKWASQGGSLPLDEALDTAVVALGDDGIRLGIAIVRDAHGIAEYSWAPADTARLLAKIDRLR